MKTISLELEDDLADKFDQLSKDKRDVLLKIWVERVISSSKSLSDLLEFSATQAEKQGITEEKLNELLKKE